MVKEIPLTQGKVTLVDDKDYEWLNQWKWYAKKSRSKWYAVRHIDRPPHTLRMHRIILGVGDNQYVDHINNDGLDNRRENIRIATVQQNRWNSPPPNNGTSEYKGVIYDKSQQKWLVLLPTMKFDDEVGAAEFYDKVIQLIYGEFAYLNFDD